MNSYCVITTIQKPTHAVKDLHDKFGEKLIIVIDEKTPSDWYYKNTSVIGCTADPQFYKLYAPRNHYARKNIGYLEAIKNKADLIYEGDDDNVPNKEWKIRTNETIAQESMGVQAGWFNVYSYFSDELIWPRGFSLRHIHDGTVLGHDYPFTSSIQQGLSEGEPDVDAIWRMVFNKRHVFNEEKSIYLNPKTWCPFNSQSTWWFPKAYPLMYLPVYATFRMCDIWRSFIAQRCLWEIGEGVTFHSPSEVYQDRNEHDLLKDFEDEVPGYLNNDNIVEILGNINLDKGEENICQNLLLCYSILVAKKILPYEEILSLNQWINDYKNITGTL